MEQTFLSSLPHEVVDLSLVTNVVDNKVTQITVRLKSLVAIADPVAFINTNDLLKNVFAKAAVSEDDYYFNLLTLQESFTEGPFYINVVRVSHGD